jgi:sulfatase maturation enzyme AslB (radical SAM superfamily)
LCPRNFFGYEHNNGYPETHFTLENAKTIFTSSFLQQLEEIHVSGNFGDIVMNPEGLQVIDYFKQQNSNLRVSVSTNGSARDKSFWQGLADLKVEVHFCIDGLADTHHLYRQNTVWNTVIKNAKIFITAGGKAVWRMIEFKHNQHQIEACRRLSLELGFVYFVVINEGRNTAPAFNHRGEHTHSLGSYNGSTDFKMLFHKKKTDTILVEDIVDDTTSIKKHVSCLAVKKSSVYISAYGEVSPCCWTGFAPSTYGAGAYHQAINSQLHPLISKNNALQYSLEECIEWFSSIQSSWNIETYQQGRLVVCDQNCGH